MEGTSRKLSVFDLSKSESGLLQSKELYQYILNTSVYPNEAEVLKDLRQATASHPGHLMLSAADEGPLMSLLLKLVNAKKTIEIGVYTGYSLLVTALSLPKDGKVIAIDPNRSSFQLGLPFFKRAGVEHKVEFIESIALPVLDKLLEDPKNEGSFDYAFVDADKSNYANYHERLLKLVKVGGIILYDNTLWSGTVAWEDDSSLDEDMVRLRTIFMDLNKKLASDSRIQISQLPVGDGLTMCMRLC
ncbi:probable caffeoyl-CoA O-methyltransferase At4g26220 [Papaver somniferum]|uniref:probable caffeoyl-CoA O-methyltransferase At4g26220 n=1 Tax=Papaver somniferum TaxID=3469 RepID=UPI000E6F6514|nr:probable caffeoyl-CoA O-methyltransferase At4g26220 [Papaver somniferum]XP_026447433.1 probable caffeoyl-CoA O-methyltransferase At4g26220 [Papaver somniferum]